MQPLDSKTNLTGDFLNDIAGHHAKSDNLGSVKYWTDTTGAPMPDRTIGWLKFLTIVGGGLGLDHMYLRSPVTGFLKLITFGGFGIWYLWDILQVYLEKERVVRYGLTAPFDLNFKTLTGVGQGMITDQPTGYKSTASFPFFVLSTLFGFTGLDSLISKDYGVFLRRAVDLVFFIVWFMVARHTQSDWKYIFYFFAAIPGIFILLAYLGNLGGLFTGYSDGVSYLDDGGLLNWFMQVYDDPFRKNSQEVHSDVSVQLRELFGFPDKTRKEVLEKFRIVDKAGPETQQNTARVGPWMWASTFGNPIGALVFSILNVIPGLGSVAKGFVHKKVMDLTTAQELLATAERVPIVGEAVSLTDAQLKARLDQLEKTKQAMEAAQVHAQTQTQTGGGMTPLSNESKILGATLGALILGGGIKGLVDYLMTD